MASREAERRIYEQIGNHVNRSASFRRWPEGERAEISLGARRRIAAMTPIVMIPQRIYLVARYGGRVARQLEGDRRIFRGP
jgi:hypothetical protein